LCRNHFKVLYTRNQCDIEKNLDAVNLIHQAACQKFGVENVKRDTYVQTGGAPDFPVLQKDGRIVSSLAESQTLMNLPTVATGFVFIDRDRQNEAHKWLDDNRDKILAEQEQEE